MFTSMIGRVRASTVGAAAVLGLMALAATVQANAACMSTEGLSKAGGRLGPALYVPGASADAMLLRVSTHDESPSIVGLWEFQTDGPLADYGTQAWHSDGTEIMFSGAQNPATGDICQGVWHQTGPSTYSLNHIAMGWSAPGAGLGIRVHFHMTVQLSRSGNSFTGHYSADVFSVSPADPFDESVKIASGSGHVTATRVKPD